MEFIGIVKCITPIQSGVSKAGKEWRSIEAVIEENEGQYPKSVVVKQMNDVIEQQRLVLGQKVKVHIDPKVSEYNGRFYNSLNCWKVEVLSQGETTNATPKNELDPTQFNDDLPF